MTENPKIQHPDTPERLRKIENRFSVHPVSLLVGLDKSNSKSINKYEKAPHNRNNIQEIGIFNNKDLQIERAHSRMATVLELSLIHISEPTRPAQISYAVF